MPRHGLLDTSTHSDSNPHQLILVIFGRDVAERVYYGDLVSHLSKLVSLHYLGIHEPRKLSFQLCCIPYNQPILIIVESLPLEIISASVTS